MLEARKLIRCTIDGITVELSVDTRMSLADILCDELRLSCVTKMCGAGECGSCVVFVNGAVQNACLYPAARADGKFILTDTLREARGWPDRLTENLQTDIMFFDFI
ncbi:MAG: 2Fe-2S iron-sulfur cluster binding domain-containing protein [Spirochaetaceae bacterium]|jgi:aerobic-type carbon monoxide dehydrogenase small subunit (CoxS/CutS family)|nr:2Fe-2S iron-sulfur cluster binding domain-containing protein [Spirochaetaceae bacterium]